VGWVPEEMWKLEKSAEESEAERCMAARGRRLEVEDGGGRALGGGPIWIFTIQLLVWWM
jgi:hypothetical protein